MPGSALGCPPLVERLVALVDRLRHVGVDVATGDVVDGARALTVLDLGDRSTLQAALRSVLIKRESDIGSFDRAFELVFSASSHPTPASPGGHRVELRSSPLHPSVLAAAVTDAVAAGDVESMARLASRAVAMLGDEHAPPAQVMHRVLRTLDLSNMLAAVLRRLRRELADDAFELALRRHEVARALEAFRRALAEEIGRLDQRRRLDHAGGELPVAAADRSVLSLSPSDLTELRRTVRPLARQLAARVGRRRRPRSSGRLDMRRTLRRSMQTGAIPLDPVLRRRHPHRPDVVLLCDVSGSVAEFAQFTFTLVHAIHDVLADVHSFAFVGGVAETTDVFADAVFDVRVRRLLERPGVIGLDGHSDYGAVFRQFAAEHIDLIGRRTTLIITGDGRSNFRDPGVDAFTAIAGRARRVYWLDPEPRADWTVDDSAIPEYAPRCDGVFEVASVRSLAAVIAELV